VDILVSTKRPILLGALAIGKRCAIYFDHPLTPCNSEADISSTVAFRHLSHSTSCTLTLSRKPNLENLAWLVHITRLEVHAATGDHTSMLVGGENAEAHDLLTLNH
jgi:hypothetical protein